MKNFVILTGLICCLQFATSLNIQNSFLHSIQRQSPDGDDWNERDRPGANQKSLLIAFDTTSSMGADLEELKKGAQDIVDNFASRKDKPIFNYVLSLFNDPKVEEPFVTRNFTVMMQKLQNITIQGGGDCPELAIEGLIRAIDIGLQKSPAFLFSDASAKDYVKYDQIAALIQRKQTSVNFILTGDCNEPDSAKYKVYTKIARTSGGQVFRLDRSSVRDVLLASSVSLETDFVPLKSFESETPGSTVVPIVVDESVTKISVSLAGTSAKLVVKDASGNTLRTSKAGPEIFSSSNIQIWTFEATSSRYTIEASAQSEYFLRIGGLSELKFDFGFSQNKPSNIKQTYFRPLAGKKTFLTVFVSDSSLVKNLEFATIIPAIDGEFEGFNVTLKKDKEEFYFTDSFDAPEKMFRLKVFGSDPKDNKIDRLISTGIEATAGIEPAVEIDYKRLSAPQNGKLVLDCNVKSLTPVKVQWRFGEISDDQEQELLDEKSFNESENFALELTKFSESKIGNYTCYAENNLGKDSMTVFVEMCSIDEDPTCTSFAINGKDLSKTLLLSSLLVFLTKFMKF